MFFNTCQCHVFLIVPSRGNSNKQVFPLTICWPICNLLVSETQKISMFLITLESQSTFQYLLNWKEFAVSMLLHYLDHVFHLMGLNLNGINAMLCGISRIENVFSLEEQLYSNQNYNVCLLFWAGIDWRKEVIKMAAKQQILENVCTKSQNVLHKVTNVALQMNNCAYINYLSRWPLRFQIIYGNDLC